MTYPVQVADICMYALNWGFRIPGRGMDAPVRQEIAERFAGWIGSLQFRSDLKKDDGITVPVFSIVYVPDPYSTRT